MIRNEVEVAMLQHETAQVKDNGICLQVQVLEHFVRMQAAKEANTISVQVHTE